MSLVTVAECYLTFIYSFISITLLMGVRGLGWGGGVRLGEGRQENKHFMNKQLSLTHV